MIYSTSNRQGFTLVEIAIVMVIIGLILGMGVGMMGPLTQRAKVNETKENINSASASIQSFAASNNRLPTIAELPTLIRSQNDAWGSPLQYITAAPLTTNNPAICNYRSTPLSLRVCNDAACSAPTTINNIAYIILARGNNANNQTAISQAAANPPAAATIINTYPVGLAVDNFAGDVNQPTDEYDDLLVWVTLDELRSKVGCQGAQLKILNNEVPAGTISSVNISFSADGGVPFASSPPTYKWCINTLPAGLTVTSGGIQNADCWTANEATWGAAAQNLVINQAAGLISGSYQITVVARDNHEAVSSPACNSATPGDNCTQKTFVLTVSP